MMFARKHNVKLSAYSKGVTLIELLVVITIMMTMMSLVAPLAVDTVDKAEAQSEYLSFCSLLRRASVKAFANGSGINIKLNNHSLQATIISPTLLLSTEQEEKESEAVFTHTYKYLDFSSVQLQLNRNGMPNINSIRLMQRNKSREIDLIALFEN